MAITFQKRQKELKRLEKQREKAERRAQKRLANRTQKHLPTRWTKSCRRRIGGQSEPRPQLTPELRL